MLERRAGVAFFIVKKVVVCTEEGAFFIVKNVFCGGCFGGVKESC